jgi:hypothetical protein
MTASTAFSQAKEFVVVFAMPETGTPGMYGPFTLAAKDSSCCPQSTWS